MVVQNLKKKEYQRITLHCITAERSHMGMSFGHTETTVLPQLSECETEIQLGADDWA